MDITPTNPHNTYDQERPAPQLLLSHLDAGCTWDDENYSCTYDVVLMVFYVMYGVSNSTWRTVWKNESPEWNVPLAEQFNLLLTDTSTAQYPSAMLCQWFSGCRNTFRGQVAASEPDSFPYGPAYASVGKILEWIFSGPTKEPLAYQTLVCEHCQAPATDFHSTFAYLGFSANIDHLHEDGDPAVLPVQVVVDRFIRRYSTMLGSDDTAQC